MPTYAVEFLPSAEKALQRLPIAAQRRIVLAAGALADHSRPTGSIKLAGDEIAWRIRVGDYRILYEVHDRRLVVLVVRIGRQKDVYRNRNPREAPTKKPRFFRGLRLLTTTCYDTRCPPMDSNHQPSD